MLSKSHSLKALLNGNAALKHLSAGARQMQQLHEQVCQQLPSSLRGHCLGVRRQAETLVIYMDSAASATLLRYRQLQLVSQLAALLAPCDRIKVQVLPETAPTQTPKSTAQSCRKRCVPSWKAPLRNWKTDNCAAPSETWPAAVTIENSHPIPMDPSTVCSYSACTGVM